MWPRVKTLMSVLSFHLQMVYLLCPSPSAPWPWLACWQWSLTRWVGAWDKRLMLFPVFSGAISALIKASHPMGWFPNLASPVGPLLCLLRHLTLWKCLELWRLTKMSFVRYTQQDFSVDMSWLIKHVFEKYHLSCCAVFLCKWFPILLVEMYLVMEWPFSISNALWF